VYSRGKGALWISSETQVVSRIVSDRQALANAIHFSLATAFPPPEHAYGDGVWIAACLGRTELGLTPGRRPGDVDLLVIPKVDGRLVYDRTIAIEVKIIRPTFERPDRNSNSFGVSQACGLLDDGFPFVGLLHISIPEPLPSELHLTIPHLSSRLGPDRQPIPSGKFCSFDPFPLLAGARQLGRLKAMKLPEAVAFKSIGLTLSEDGERIVGNTIGDDRRGAKNPKTDSQLLRRVQELVDERCDVFSKVKWFDDGDN